MKHIHAFDFDGTITVNDSLPAFLLFSRGVIRFALAFVLLAPLMVLSFMRLYEPGRAKELLFCYLFRGMPANRFQDLCERFAQSGRVELRPQALLAISQAQASGHEVFIVTASVSQWVQGFFPDICVIGTEVQVIDGRLTGRFSTPNCSGAEKVRRLLAVRPDRSLYHLTAYGDSHGDRELLDFADVSYYQPFRE